MDGRRIGRAAALVLALLAGVAYAEYEYSTDELRAWAERGNFEAQMTLGQRYLLGDGVPQDFAEGLRWFRAGAEQGDAEAQFVYAEVLLIVTFSDPPLSGESVAKLPVHVGVLGPEKLAVVIEVYAWLNVAAVEIEEAKERRDSLAGLMGRHHIQDAQRLSQEIWRRINT